MAHDPTVNNLRALLYMPDGNIFFKLSFEDEFEILPQRPVQKPMVEPSPLYKHKLTISQTKWKHLQELKAVIPSDTHGFYDSIQCHPDKTRNKLKESSVSNVTKD